MPNVRIDPDLYEKLQAEQEATGVPITRVVNHLVDSYLSSNTRNASAALTRIKFVGQ